MEAGPKDIEWSLSWQLIDGRLHGRLTARNVADHPVQLSHKPALSAVGTDGTVLDAATVHTMEYKQPPFVVLSPGQAAMARVTWSGWNGGRASGRFIIGWRGGTATVTAQGPRQPSETGSASNFTAGWFELVPQPEPPT